jgi:LuxR family maltose regulon positive regulatory protein
VVRGPAGIGKTVLVSQWLAADDRRFAWVTLDRADDEPGHLVRRLVDALVGACRTVALGDAGAVGDDRGFDANLLLDRLVAAPGMLDPDLVLVLDDVDRVRGAAGRAVLAALVEHAHTRLVLVCRHRPAIGLERARLRGAVDELPASALRFERGEVKELIERRRGAHAAAEIEQATRGWAAGLRLLELGGATGDHRALAAATADEPNARAYVREEVLADLSHELVELLYTTCWLPIFTLDVCRALASDLPGAARLGEAAIEAVPLMPIASRPGAFRYPPLLAEILRRESAARDGDAGASRLYRAASAAQNAGELDIAIELYLDGGAYDQAADACIALMRRDPNALRAAHGWFGTIPPETLLGDGARIAARVRAALAVGDIATARSWATSAAACTGSRGRELRTPELLHARAAVAQRCGDFETLLECAAALTHSPDPTTAAPAHAARVRALVWQGRLDAARAALSRFADVAPALPRSTTDLATARAWVAWLEGDASQAWKAAGGIIGEDTADEARYAELVLLAGAAQREQNRLADAVRLLETAATLAKRTSHSVVAVLAACELAAVRAANGAILPALESIIATGDAHPGLPPAVVDQLRTTEARLRLRNGDIEGVATLLCDATETVDTRLLQARLAMARGSLDLPGLLAGLEPVTPRQEVQCCLIRAAYHAKAAEGTGSSKGRDVADHDVLAAVSRGGPLGLVRTFLDEDPALLASLRRLAATHGDIALGRLAALAAEDAAAPPLADAARPLTQLTQRELGVLRLLPTRLSNREMAAELYVSVNTLKSHVRSIYRKLGVAGRSEAIRRARALHLV